MLKKLAYFIGIATLSSQVFSAQLTQMQMKAEEYLELVNKDTIKSFEQELKENKWEKSIDHNGTFLRSKESKTVFWKPKHGDSVIILSGALSLEMELSKSPYIKNLLEQ